MGLQAQPDLPDLGRRLGRVTEAIYALIEIQRARPVSNALAERTGVPHESPQAILLRNAQVAWHASHYDINLTALERA
jgi:bacillithiol system protein YtxJ